MKKSQPASLGRIKAAVLVTWHERGRWDLGRRMRAKLHTLTILHPFFFENARFLQKLSRITAELYIPVLALARRRDTDVVFSWSMRMGICYGLLNRLFDPSTRPFHVVRDFHINLARKDVLYRMKLLLLRSALPGIDRFLCTSKAEERIYGGLFGIDPSNIRFYPDSPAQAAIDLPSVPSKDYVLSYGNSDRDFDTLVEAARIFDKQVIILSQNYTPRRALPPNIRFISRRIPEDGFIRLIQAARVVVLPLKFYAVAAGQNTMLEAMSLGRPLVVSANLATRHYGSQGRTALFYAPQKASQLAECVLMLWENPGWAEQIGKQAREEMRNWRNHAMEILYGMLREMFGIRET